MVPEAEIRLDNKYFDNMKKLVIVIASIAMMLCGTDVFAQGKFGADSAECIKYLSYYSEYYKQKNYDDAIPSWRQAYHLCPPTARQNMLIEGTTLIRELIKKNAKNPEYRAALVDTLLTLHNLRAQYYPTYAVSALNNKGLDVANYLRNDSKRSFEEYSSIVAANKQLTKPNIFIFHMQSALDLHGKGQISTEDIIKVYQDDIAYIEKAKGKDDKENEAIRKAKTDLESLFISSKVASCENLIELFTPRYEANPEDLQLAETIVRIMSMTEGCTDNNLFLNAATTMYRLSPSYTSAYFLYRLNGTQGNVKDAIKYLEEAIAYPESDNLQDADYSYELAVFCHKNAQNGKAYEAARKAVELNPEIAGKCYFLIGSIWGSTTCGGDEIERRAPYWVAVDYLQKAKAADESLAEEANRMIAQFAKFYPQTAEAFMYDITDGDSYTVRCGGMTAVTTVRTQK